jgi:hypothetical protein
VATGNWTHGISHGQERKAKGHGNTHVANFSASDYSGGESGKNQDKSAKQFGGVFHSIFHLGNFRYQNKPTARRAITTFF